MYMYMYMYMDCRDSHTADTPRVAVVAQNVARMLGCCCRCCCFQSWHWTIHHGTGRFSDEAANLWGLIMFDSRRVQFLMLQHYMLLP